MIRLLLIGYPALICESLAKVLSKEKDFKVTGVVDNQKEAMEQVRRREYDVIIVKTILPELNGIELLKKILDLDPFSKVLILSMGQNQQTIFQAYEIGAVGFISLNEKFGELVSAIRKVHEGGVYISSKMAEEIVRDIHRQPEPKGKTILSPREYEVFMKIINGKTMTEIIKEMRVAPSTVTTLRKRVLKKTGQKNNCELIKYALREKIITL